MHPQALVEACSDLLRQVLTFEHPADAVVSRFFREHRHLGPRERATLAETTYTVLRRKLQFERLARSGTGPRERRLALLGFAGGRGFLQGALSSQESDWLDACNAVQPEEWFEPERHNLPAWLAERLKAQTGADFWPLCDSLLAQAPLVLRVNTLKAKRPLTQYELEQAAIISDESP